MHKPQATVIRPKLNSICYADTYGYQFTKLMIQ